MEQHIGWIGTGVMGKAMCAHILNAGYKISVYNRTKEKAKEIVDMGATWCSNPKEVAEKSNFVFTIVGFPHDVEEVYLGENGILKSVKNGSIIVDMTTSEPSLAQRIYNVAKKMGVSSLDAPVSGGDIGAKNGTLAIMIGGDKETYEKVLPFFELMGENISYMGKEGAGQHTKMSNQILIASTMIGTIESLLYAYKAGNDLDEVIQVIGKGAAGCWSINNLGPRIAKNNFEPGFFLKHFVKDMDIALKEARNMNLSLPGLALAHQFYMSAMALGLENLGSQGLYKVLGKMNGIDV
ncbi:MAG: NAD(P)-dependent oxidoreductase [Candidatus Lokiarchaeota archaeon]|nr:NAD(P)-dependent oxidoreductase [Candidatus Lokiarchaeota archaeon]